MNTAAFQKIRSHGALVPLCLSAALLTVALSFYRPIAVSFAQSDATQPVEGISSETVELSARELELRRKEEELLQAMSGIAPSQSQSPNTTAKQPISQSVPQEPTEKVITVQTTEIVNTDSQTQEVVAKQPVDEHVNQLRALEHHPALDQSRPKKTQAPKPSNTIRTHLPAGDDYDGTTAARVGTFRRVDRSPSSGSGVERENIRSRMVPLSEIEQEASVRNVSLSQEELATIRSPSTKLRTGPTKLDATLGMLPQYSEVSIDYRSGSWYRVRTETGMRGWVPGSALLFDAGISSRSAVRIGAVTGNVR